MQVDVHWDSDNFERFDDLVVITGYSVKIPTNDELLDSMGSGVYSAEFRSGEVHAHAV